MSFSRHYVQQEIERVQNQSPYRQQTRDSMECHYLCDYRERQHRRQHRSSSPTHRRVRGALMHIQHGRQLLAAKLAALHERVREVKRVYYGWYGYDYDSGHRCDCGCYDCMQRTRLAIYFRDLEEEAKRAGGLYYEEGW
ncbi:hypothetical protein SLS62_006136 [Diatrype stigma]|uniref:Uncharacterized protein n=1 Tax=Diatrype stigma TaxID=117547 RepID=A0AAN9YS43_9PEZI